MRSGPSINLSHRFLLEQLLFECTRDLLCNKTVEWLHFMVLSCVWLFVTPGTVAYQAPLSIEFSRQDYQSGLPLPTLGDPPDIGTEPVSLASPALQEDSLSLVPPGKPNSISWEASNHKMCEVLSTEDWMELITSSSASPGSTILLSHIGEWHTSGLYCSRFIQTPRQTRPHRRLAASLDEWKCVLQILWNWWSLSFFR